MGLGCFALALAGPVAPVRAQVVPPGNPAATQYTETYPSAGGNASTGKGRSPAQALGRREARRLEGMGPQGRAAAEAAAATAPASVGTSARDGAARAASHGGVTRVRTPGAVDHREGAGSGSSGVDQVIGQATGASSGDMGALLPLITLGAIGWAGAYAWRRRRGATSRRGAK